MFCFMVPLNFHRENNTINNDECDGQNPSKLIDIQ